MTLCPYSKAGFSLVELATSIGILLAMAVITMFAAGSYSRINDSRQAGAILKEIDSARTSYLVDNPNLSYGDLSVSIVTPYMPNPGDITNLPTLGYSVGDGNVQSFPLSYHIIKQGALPINGFTIQ
jgi:type II secretory pathway pseudopilin PulG